MAGIAVRRLLASKAIFSTVQLPIPSKAMLKRGTQILYIPQHAGTNVLHQDVEAGFVTSTSEVFAFCRYWNDELFLRTKANSEATPFAALRLFDSVEQSRVDEALERHC